MYIIFEKSELDAKLADATIRSKKLAAQIVELEAAHTNVSERSVSVTRELQTLHDQHSAATTSVTTLQQQLTAKDQALVETRATLATTSDELLNERKANARLTTERDANAHAVADLTDQNRLQAQQLTELRLANDAVKLEAARQAKVAEESLAAS